MTMLAARRRTRMYEAALRERLGEALKSSLSRGVKRSTIAAALGVSESTLDAYSLPGRDQAIPGDRLLELLCRDDVLPERERMELVRWVGLEAGVLCVVVEAEGRDAQRGIVGAMAELGDLAEEVAAAEDAAGPAGAALTEEEFRRVAAEAAALVARVLGVVEACRAAMRRGSDAKTERRTT